MVELCELKILPEADEWPDDMDDRVANLDFGAGDSLFGSLIDGTVSTDSLDSEQLRQRCQYKKEDYKLTIADSGQWMSGVGGVAGGGTSSATGFTTWGRIHSTEPLDEKTASAPNMSTSPRPSTQNAQRPASLLENFAQRQDTVDLGALVLDVNDNEVQRRESTDGAVDRWRAARPTSLVRTPNKPRRTFADLTLDTATSTPNNFGQKKTAPELQFLQLPHQVGVSIFYFLCFAPCFSFPFSNRNVLTLGECGKKHFHFES